MQDFDVKADDMEDMDNMHNSENQDQNIERNTEQNSEQTGIKGDDSDFKYCMQDTEKVYIGARYSYAELMEDDHIPFKFQTIIEHYIAKDTSLDTTLESQLYYMKPDDFTCRTYEHLRAKVKFQSMKEKRTLFGGKKMRYVEETLPVGNFAEINLAQKKASGVIIRELVLSKMGIAGFRV